MSPDLQQKLRDAYPQLFIYPYPHHHIHSPYGLFGIECGDGWYGILDDLAKAIVAKSKRPPVITQIKEKFGTLRFYVDAASDEVWDLIDAAEKKSATVCERCGKSGVLRADRSWIATLCDGCNTIEP